MKQTKPSTFKPPYWNKSLKFLSSQSLELATIISKIPKGLCIERRTSTAFAALARSITGQQISMKAAASVWNKLVEAIGNVMPENILEHQDSLRSCGYSGQKKSYLIDLAEHFIEHNLETRIAKSSFAEVQPDLLAVKGIGNWSTEMFGIFYMMEPDLWPIDDLGLVTALCRQFPTEPFAIEYAETKKITGKMRREINSFGDQFAPYRSVACWLLWRSLENSVMR